jgi:Zn-dependent M28 family amino/carboxypeptidase
MVTFPTKILRAAVLVSFLPGVFAGCKASGNESAGTTAQPPFMSTVASAPPQTADDALPPEKTGSFDGQRAFSLVAKQVGFGPRPSGSPAIAKLQDFLLAELQSYGCTVETDNFSAETPVGRLTMKNLLVKIPGEKPGIILLGTHYDTKLLDKFVGADDGGSSTALMLEIARLLCKQRGKYAVWIAFFDGEEAVKQWSDTDGRYGSRQMGARLAMSHDASKIRAFLLADIVGGRNPAFKRESTSTKWLVDLVWEAARKLGYANAFVEDSAEVQDDHDPFLRRGVPSADVINDFTASGYWHTPQDTLDKISPKTLGIVGHVFLESLKELQLR